MTTANNCTTQEIPPDILAQRIQESSGPYTLSGLKGAAQAYLLSRIWEKTQKTFLLVTGEPSRAEAFKEDLEFFLGSAPEISLYPPWDVRPFEPFSPHSEVIAQRMEVLYLLLNTSQPLLVVSSIQALLQKILPCRTFLNYCRTLKAEEEYQWDEIFSSLEEAGYYRTTQVEDRGSYCVRGGIVDIFPPSYPFPIRMERYGDFIESMRYFDPASQRSRGPISELTVLPMSDVILNQETIEEAVLRIKPYADSIDYPKAKRSHMMEDIRNGIRFGGIEFLLPFFYPGLDCLFDFLPRETFIVLEDPLEVERSAKGWLSFLQQRQESVIESRGCPPPVEDLFLSFEDFLKQCPEQNTIRLDPLALSSNQVHYLTETNEDIAQEINLQSKEQEILAPLLERLPQWQQMGWAVFLITSTPSQAHRVQQLLQDLSIPCSILQNPFPGQEPIWREGLNIVTDQISSGFRFPSEGLVLLTDKELFGEKVRLRKRPPLPEGLYLSSLDDLKADDYVVHTQQGIGQYLGLVQMQVLDETHDFLLIEYLDQDKLYVPVFHLNMVQKYIGPGGENLKLDRLGGERWKRVTRRARESVEKIAGELVDLYARRKVLKGHAFTKPDHYYREFETSFRYEETPDQSTAIEDVLMDMERKTPMDRLICGDVGFGKTEVAIRAAFKTIMDGKQVAMLVPTTVLAQQHYSTFSSRFADYPINVEMLSRFRSAREQKKILAQLEKGSVDILIGTHRILQDDVQFRGLGLLILDEEHRFGVRHKEKIKHLRETVDALTLTATPIPRTLQMSLMGIRDLSVITTPPPDRHSIRTFISRFDDHIIREAVLEELKRGGQVFFVHNQVKTIQAMATLLHRIVPEASIGVAHGQMPERSLEKTMLDFLNRKFDLLLCSAIIESGLDFPSVNTIIINRAERFGLAQLYQLRGRVGRAKRQAKAYLLIAEEETLSRDAQKRLEALKNMTTLGSGYKLAIYDLEIRGAGNLLGTAQSGHIASVGYEMYMDLLENAIKELKGEAVLSPIEPEIHFKIPSRIPEDYVEDTNQRLVLYKRLSSLKIEDEVEELREECLDRYGPIPQSLEYLFQIVRLKAILKELRIAKAHYTGEYIGLVFDPSTPVEASCLVKLVEQSRGDISLSSPNSLLLKPAHPIWEKAYEEVKNLLQEIRECAK